MDWLEILVVSAAAVSVLAFIGLTIVLLRQGHAIRGLEQRVARGEGAGGGAALDRLRQLQAQGGAASAAPAGAPPATAPTPSGPAGGSGGGRSPRWLVAGGLGALVVALALGAAWFLVIRDDGGSAQATRTTETTPRPRPRNDLVPANPAPLDNKAAYTVAVLNGSGVNQAAANTGPRVQQAGYTVGVVGNAARSNVAVSMVMYPPGKQVVAQNVARDLGIRRAPPLGPLAAGLAGGADAVVVVGRDIAGTP